MSAPHASSIKYFTRGGQTFLHNFRMIIQIIERVAAFILITFIFFTAMLFWKTTSEYQRYLSYQKLNAEINLFINENATQVFKNLNGKVVTASSKRIANATFIKQAFDELCVKLVKSSLYSGILSLFILGFTTTWLKRRGKKQTDDQIIKGDTLVDNNTLARLIEQKDYTLWVYLSGTFLSLIGLKKKKYPLRIAHIPLPRDVERSHIMIHGSTGVGKSTAIRELLDTIFANGERAIIYDKSGDFVRHYYRYEKDILLNPLDERGTNWSLWDECHGAPDYDSLACALMPMPGGNVDPFWVNGARTLFSAAAYAMRTDPERSTYKLLKTLLTADLNSISALLKGTEAETLVAKHGEKTAVSIKSVLATYIKSLKYIRDTHPTFSIRRWVQNDKQSNCLFISSFAKQHETLKPLISSWLDIAANELMSLEPSDTRRIWLIFDELTSLHKLPYLNSAFAESRKFGGCLIIGIQSIAQLREVYGQNGAEEISGLCNTRLFFRSPTSDTANWVSKELGLCEVAEVREGISYGENAMRAGISLSQQHTQRQLVNYSEVMALKNLETYIRFPEGLPVTKLAIPYKKRNADVTPFIPREIPAQSLAEIDVLIDQYEKAGVNEFLDIQKKEKPTEETPPHQENLTPEKSKKSSDRVELVNDF